MTALPLPPSAPPAATFALALTRDAAPPARTPNPETRTPLLADPNVPHLWWVPIDAAAHALDVTPRALRMRGEELMRAGMAKQLSATVGGGGRGGGQTKWHFSTRLDPRLAALATRPLDHSTTSELAPDPLHLLASAPAAKQAQARAKATAVRLFRAWRRANTVTDPRRQHELLTAVEARCGLRPDLRRLYEWSDKAGPCNCETPDGFAAACAALLDRRGGSREATCTRLDEPAWEFFTALYLRGGRAQDGCGPLSIAKCWRLTRARAAEQGWTWVSLSRAKQLIAERLSRSVIRLARGGEEAWAREHLPSLEQHPDAWAVGQRADTDHSRFDFFVRVLKRGEGGKMVWAAVRPWLTTIIDWRSRRLLGWSVDLHADSDAFRAALHHTLSQADVSVPEHLWLDNGKDFASEQFTGATKSQRRSGADQPWPGLLALFGITAHFATPYNHNGKARVESAYRVSHNDFDRCVPSYCGSDREPRAQEAIDGILANPESLPTLDEVRRDFALWARAHNAASDHHIDHLRAQDGTRLSRAAYYTAALPRLSVLPDKARLLPYLEHKWSRPITPHKNGVSIRFDGRAYSYGQHEAWITDLVGSGRRVYVTYNPDDLSRVRVYGEDFGLLGEASLNHRHGGLLDDELKRQDLKAAHARQREHKRRMRAEVDTAAAVLPAAELAALVRREREQAQTRSDLEAAGTPAPEGSPPMRLVRTALTDRGAGHEENRNAVPLRKAAGAEHDEFPAGFAAEVQRVINGSSPAAEDADLSDLGPFSLLDLLGEPDRSPGRARSDGPDAGHSLAGIDILRELGA